MGDRTVAAKMGIKPGWTAYFAHAPQGVLETLCLPELDVVPAPDGELDYIHVFVVTREQMYAEFPRYVSHLAPWGKLWLSWPKSRKLGSDLSLPTVIEIGYGYGLVESTCLRLDDTWSGLRFTRPKRGKVYRNSHGVLPTSQ